MHHDYMRKHINDMIISLVLRLAWKNRLADDSGEVLHRVNGLICKEYALDALTIFKHKQRYWSMQHKQPNTHSPGKIACGLTASDEQKHFNQPDKPR